jgi:cobalt-precorrin-5B (C1)-methyltransferase
MKKGFTTGSCAAAAAKGAIFFEKYKKLPDFVVIRLPQQRVLQIPIFIKDGLVGVVKDAGDDPDVTHKIEIFAKINITKGKKGVEVAGGKGVGIVTKKGLQVDVGKPAINPKPMQMIVENALDMLADDEFAHIEIIVPKGEEVAKKTFNERLGIIGGISILGTTGIVEPMSLSALIATIECEIDVLISSGVDYFYLVPGKIGERHLKQYTNIPSIQVSNYFDSAFKYLLKKGIKRFGIAGHPGKIAKLAMGFYNTHSKSSPQANKFITELLKIDREFNTVEEICRYTKNVEFDTVALSVKNRLKKDFGFDVDVLLMDMEGKIVGKA